MPIPRQGESHAERCITTFRLSGLLERRLVVAQAQFRRVERLGVPPVCDPQSRVEIPIRTEIVVLTVPVNLRCVMF